MSIELIRRVQRFRTKSSDISFPEHIVDFESGNFSISGIKPLHEVMDEIQSAFVWCWSIKDHLKETLFEKSDETSKNVFNKTFESEIDKYGSLKLCANIANTGKHKILNRPPRSGYSVKLDIVQIINVSSETVSKIQRLNGNYFITPKNNKAVKLKANIVNERGAVVMDAFCCLDESVAAWIAINSKYSTL
ncbi:hypothetical protein O3296_14920 [Escherichia coli]|uniref:hypothetical protein n=1 Tax=Escherichia coli TaxID=562 RepID=UPI0022B50067|nr:hypothetical protein [Escherichia coli]WAZ86647.1 hypothetical protein O3296_14920 [Escherichia coli]